MKGCPVKSKFYQQFNSCFYTFSIDKQLFQYPQQKWMDAFSQVRLCLWEQGRCLGSQEGELLYQRSHCFGQFLGVLASLRSILRLTMRLCQKSTVKMWNDNKIHRFSSIAFIETWYIWGLTSVLYCFILKSSPNFNLALADVTTVFRAFYIAWLMCWKSSLNLNLALADIT